ncbi:MAG TPA: PAS domain-containing protein [Actinomycetota bacterium]
MARPPGQRNLILILARDFASRLATAVFLVDEQGTVIYFNEAAERLLGTKFVEGREMTADDWSTRYEPSDLGGKPVSLDEIPLGVAIQRREPAHGALRIRAADGVQHPIESTAFPLLAHTDECVGAIAIFWESAEA